MSLQIIKLLLDKEAFTKWDGFIQLEDLYKNHYALLRTMHSSYDGDIPLKDYIELANEKRLDFIADLEIEKVSQKTIEELIRINSERTFSYKLGLLCMEVFEGRREISEVFKLYERYEDIGTNEVKEDFVTDSFEELAVKVHNDTGLKWRLESLNKSIGSISLGAFGFIFARPETGKTTFLASEISFMAEQATGPVIWFNNEEQGERVKTRIAQAALGLTKEEMFGNLLESEESYIEVTGGRLKLYDRAHLHKRDVERLIKSLNPSLVVVDQIDKVRGFKADREDLALGAIYIWARELAKQYCPVIGVCQAAATAENKRWLTMDDVAKSKTEKAAEADFIIGIGKRHDVGMETIRFLSIIKNKLGGIHSKIQCTIKPSIARYEEL